MQKNRSFDHYFGSMKGVRGLGDRATILLPGGKSIWEQPQTPDLGAPTQYPWPLSGTDKYDGAAPPSPELGAANYPGTSHGWEDQHAAWYGGLMNGWYAAKGGPTTLGFSSRRDLPYHYGPCGRVHDWGRVSLLGDDRDGPDARLHPELTTRLHGS